MTDQAVFYNYKWIRVRFIIMRKLHHLALSPFCRKVRRVLAEKKLEVELIDEPVWEKDWIS